MAALVDLKTDGDLINPNFGNYRLSLDPVASYDAKLDKDLDVAKPPESNFTSHHARLFNLHNHIFSDHWDARAAYFCDTEWHIGKVISNQVSQPEVSTVFQVPEASNLRLKPARLNVSLSFPNQTLAFVCDGVETLYLLDTGDRQADGKWKTVFSKNLSVSGGVAQLLDSSFWMDGENHRAECLLASVEEVEGEKAEHHRSPFLTVLLWWTLLSVDGKEWTLERTRRVEGSLPPKYACLDRKGSSVHIVCQRAYRLVEDSVKPVDASEDFEVIGDEEPSPMYTWGQTAADLSIQLTIPEGLAKADLNVSFGSNTLEVGVKNGVDMIKGKLHAKVDMTSCTWTLDGRRLEINLEKVEEEMWPTAVVGDTRGEMVMTEAQIEAIHERLADLTSEHWNDIPDQDKKPFNTQSLEECDHVDEDGVLLMRIDGETHRISHKVIANHQFLFAVSLEPNQIPAICLRHDVDGLLWQATNEVGADQCPWTHVGSLNAFGFVLASKQLQRFCSCSPDMSLAVIADSHRHIYLYRQKVSIPTPLRNRKQGTMVTSVAKQQVISIEKLPNVILGIRVTNKHMFVATEEKILVYDVTCED